MSFILEKRLAAGCYERVKMRSRRGKKAGSIGLLSMRKEKSSMNERLKEQA